MTAPDQPDAQPVGKFRAGTVVTFRHPDPASGETLTGRALVVKDDGDGSVAVLPLSLFHLEVDRDNLTPAKVSDVLPAALQQPADEQPAS